MPGDQVEIVTGDQGTVGRQPIVRVGQVQHWHQHLFALDLGALHPDDVVGQGRDLFGGQADANGQIKLLLALDGVVHQVLEQLLVTGLSCQQALTGTRYYRLLDQPLLVVAIAQAFPTVVGVVTEVGQQVVRAHELLEVGERRVGFDQVLVRLRPGSVVRQALHAVDHLIGR
ncbi:hypothetical protein D3C77_417960 [compost metagenome]